MRWSTSKLELGELDRSAVAAWLARGRGQTRLTLVENIGPWPDRDVERVCRMYEIMNTAPQEDFAREPEPEIVD